MSQVIDLQEYRLLRRFQKIIDQVDKYPELFPLLEMWIAFLERHNFPAAESAAARLGDELGRRRRAITPA